MNIKKERIKVQKPYGAHIIVLIICLIMVLPGFNVLSNSVSRAPIEPQLTDNMDGNWTATWSFENPDNYTLTNIDLNNEKATLKFNNINFVEIMPNDFSNGSSENIIALGAPGIGLDLSKGLTILIADSGNNRVIEVDDDKWLWQYGSNSTSGYGLNELDKPSFAVRLPNNNRLITDTDNNRVIEVGRNGEFYWQFGSNTTSGKGDNLLKKPCSAVPMANGNILIADSANNQIIEVNRSKNIVWQYDIDLANPTYAEELSNGSILITDNENHWIIEVNDLKQIYWSYGVKTKPGTQSKLDTPTFATRLDNGNTLIADTNNHRVIEITPAKSIVWQYGKTKVAGYGLNRLTLPRCAVRLKNGDTLIADTNNHRVVEVFSEIIWKGQYGTNGTGGSGPNQLNGPNSGLPLQKSELFGNYISKVFDGGNIANWGNISWNQTVPTNSELKIYTRTGDTSTPPTGSWSSWSAIYQNPDGDDITSPNNRYIQYKVEIVTNDVNVTPFMKNVTINGFRYELTGELETEFFEPTGLLGWQSISWDAQLNGQSMKVYYSTDLISPWTLIPVNKDLTDAPIDSGKIRFKFNFTTSDFSISPVLNSFSIIFAILGNLDTLSVSPDPVEVVVGEQLNFTATGYDKYGRTMVIAPSWSTTIGVVINGTLTAQTTPGVGYVNATVGSVIGNARVTVLPGPLDHIIITPYNITIIAGETQDFNAKGYDKYNNEIPIEPVWSTTVGRMEDNLLIAQNFAGKGIVSVCVDDVCGIANITIKLNESTHHPPRIISRVPDQVKPEDSQPWTLNLRPYEADDEDEGEDLLWYLTGIDEELYTVTGAFSNEDKLTFIPKQHAFGFDNATLWLIDSDNMTAKQPLWVNITPVNDKPVIADAPDIQVHYDEAFVFDYSNYVHDIETPDDQLKLSILESSGQQFTTINGLNITYNYPQSMLGKTQDLTLVVSDGEDTGEDIIQVSVTDNHAPKLIKPFSTVTMYEDESRNYIFALSNHFSDPDGDVLTFSYNANFITVTIHDNNTVSIKSPSAWSGTEIITFRAMDELGAVAEGFFKVVVIEVNDPPKISPIPDIYVHHSYEYRFNISKYISDPDNETNELIIWTSDIEHIKQQGYDNTILFLTYPETLLGQVITVTLFVSDGLSFTSADFKVHVTDNFPPTIKKKLQDIYFNEDEELKNAFNLEEHFTDKDDAELTYTFTLEDEENITIVINSNNTVDISSKADWFGSTLVSFQAVDRAKAFVETEIKLVVIPVNDAPAIDFIPAQKGKVGERWVLDLAPYLSDVDNDVTELEIKIPPKYAKYITVTGRQLTFHSNKTVDIDLEFIVTDGHLNSTGVINLKITGEKSEIFFGVWILVSIIIIFIIGTIMTVIRKRRGNFIITDAFIVHNNGLLIKYKGNTLNQDLDEDIFSGMFTGIQSLISDSFGETLKQKNSEALLSQLKMGDYEIMFKRGEYISLIAIFKGKPGQRLPKLLLELVTEIEKKHGTALEDWDGRYLSVKGIDKIVEPHLSVESRPKAKEMSGTDGRVNKIKK